VNFLNVGPWELMVILIIAILLVGPKRVVEIVQTVRRFAGQLSSLSREFTSIIQAEVQDSEMDQDAQGAPEGEAMPASGDQDVSRKAEPGLMDTLREGIAPIRDLQTELRTTAQETREALESVVQQGMEPIGVIQTELQEAAKITRQALQTPIQGEPTPPSGTQAEPQDTARGARQTPKDIATEITEGDQGTEEEQNEQTD
jgi:Sec-independent protein translocase protein TatA